ncbi:MAG: hypothetical protein ABFC88_13455 [Thermoguttaceae bacterium]
MDNFRTERFSESKATKHLNWLFYFGCGSKYLGWDFGCSQLMDDGSWKLTKAPGPRVWPTPTDSTDRVRWSPVWLHLKGCPRGVCRGQNERFVPFISVDLDRHDGTVQSKAHFQSVIETGRLLKGRFGYLKWLVEVNPKNGSTKYFGFTGRPIPIEYANALSQNISECLVANGIGPREVFPFNSPQVFLPMRAGKTTIIDNGILEKCERRRGNRFGQRERFQTYSAIGLVEWLRCGRSFDERTLKKALVSACLQLPDRPIVVQSKVIPSSPIRKPVKPVSTPSNLENEPDSFIRQRQALLEFCRKNRRVVSVEEGLSFIKNNGLFTGAWCQNQAKRRLRVAQILSFISKSFDGSLCTGVRHEINFNKFDSWAKRHCKDGWRPSPRKWLDEYGNIFTKQKGRTVADWKYVSTFLSLTEYLTGSDKNKDETVPTARVQSLWDLLFEQGVISVQFCPRKLKIVRDNLERLGVLKINHCYFRGQAMKWWTGLSFPGLGLWKSKKVKRLGEAVPLTEFLLGQKKKNKHNPLLQQAMAINADLYQIDGSGADPPPIKEPTRQFQMWNGAKMSSLNGDGLLNSKV